MIECKVIQTVMVIEKILKFLNFYSVPVGPLSFIYIVTASIGLGFA